jgi:hypothetical protein
LNRSARKAGRRALAAILKAQRGARNVPFLAVTRLIRCATHGAIAPYEYVFERQYAGNINGPSLWGKNGVISMNRIAETFWIASALALGVALAVAALPIVAIVCFLALALPVAMQSVRQRYCGDVVSPSTRNGSAGRSRVPPTIETTYTVDDRS